MTERLTFSLSLLFKSISFLEKLSNLFIWLHWVLVVAGKLNCPVECGIFLEGSNLHHPHCKVSSLPLGPWGSPKIISFYFNFSLFCVCVSVTLSCVWPSATPWTVAHQAPRRFSRQECWSGLSCPPPGDLPNPGIEPASLTSPALTARFFTTSATREARMIICYTLVCYT